MSEPTAAQLAASIGCDPSEILRSVLHKRRTAERADGRQVWTSFVDVGQEEKVAVFETVWPQ